MKSYHDIVGDGGSDVLGQVQAQEESIARSLAEVQNLVAIGSGKGGVGKSTVTMQLACALHELGDEVAILDADLNGPCQARLGGLREQMLIPGKSGAARALYRGVMTDDLVQEDCDWFRIDALPVRRSLRWPGGH